MSTFDQTKHDELFETARALAVIHSLLTNGIFQGSGYKELALTVPFIQNMHIAVMKDLEPLIEQKALLDEAAAKASEVINE